MLLTMEKVMLLGGAPFFAELPGRILAEIATRVEEIDCEAGDALFQRGEYVQAMYIVVSGEVELRGQVARVVGENGFFSELAAMRPAAATYDAVATTDARLLKLEHDALQELLSEHAAIAASLIRYLCALVESGG